MRRLQGVDILDQSFAAIEQQFGLIDRTRECCEAPSSVSAMSPRKAIRPAGARGETWRLSRRPTPRRLAGMPFSRPSRGRWRDIGGGLLLARETLDFVDICAPPWRACRNSSCGRSAQGSACPEREAARYSRRGCERRRGGGRARRAELSIQCTTGSRRRSAEKISALVREGAVGAVRSVQWRTLRTQPAIAAGTDGPGTGASIRNWRAGGYCSITAGMRSIAS